MVGPRQATLTLADFDDAGLIVETLFLIEATADVSGSGFNTLYTTGGVGTLIDGAVTMGTPPTVVDITRLRLPSQQHADKLPGGHRLEPANVFRRRRRRRRPGPDGPDGGRGPYLEARDRGQHDDRGQHKLQTLRPRPGLLSKR